MPSLDESDGTGFDLGTIATFSLGPWDLPTLSHLLGAERSVLRPSDSEAVGLGAVVGPGDLTTDPMGIRYASRHDLPYFSVSPGPIRAIHPDRDKLPLSMIVDDLGPYDTSSHCTRLESLLAATTEGPLDDNRLLARAATCRQTLVDAGVSEYNYSVDLLPDWIDQSDKPVVLVADQSHDDPRARLNSITDRTFELMMSAALDENPDALIVLVPPAGGPSQRKLGRLCERRWPSRVRIVDPIVGPIALVKRAQRTYVVSARIGFDALMVATPVSCFGLPFYSGWGLTDDRCPAPRRGRPRSIDQLFAAVFLVRSRYLDPFAKTKTTVEAIIEHVALQRRRFLENRGDFLCVGFTWWKRPFVRRYLESPGANVRFVRRLDGRFSPKPDVGTRAVVWSSRISDKIRSSATKQGLPLMRMEDGFLRSVGLGSDHAIPGSLVLDSRGIYYDPSMPSDLEVLLSSVQFEPEELHRASRLRELIVSSRLSKYNPLADRKYVPKSKPGQRVVLVPGQVADDASVRLGSLRVPDVATLLKLVRERRPECWIVYKPHPDVLSGNRRGHIDDGQGVWFDEIVTDIPIPRCLETVHEVHTMSSLVGFEALLRELPVFVYGQPFYCGWGLTDDYDRIARRNRRLTLEELVAGTLIRYPRYYSWRHGAFCTAEQMVTELARGKGQSKSDFGLPRPLRRARNLLRLARELLATP